MFEKLSPQIHTIGWIGTGVMGQPMCKHIMELGFRVNVFSRTKEKAVSLLNSGAVWMDTPGKVAAESTVIFSIVGFPPDVRDVYLGSKGILESAKPGTILIDMTTTQPSLAKEIAVVAESKGAVALDAPVSGGDIGARNGKLSIMVGGDETAFNIVLPLLEALGKKIVYQGGPGSGQHTKMCNQITIASTMIGVCEALIYGYKAGLDLETMLSSISGGAAACWTLDNLAPRILKRNFDPGFFVEHFIKDMKIALDEAEAMQLSLPGLALVHQLYLSILANDGGKLGTQSLILGLEKLAGLTLRIT